MKTEELILSITESITDRFYIEDATDFSNMLLDLTENKHLQKSIMRIQRIKKQSETQLVTWKTMLIIELKSNEELKNALEWTASVKDALLDPETADLYLFIIFKNDDIKLDQSLRIEATEQFCRKYVQRPNKSANELIERTFLSRLKDTKQGVKSIDPLNNALALTEKNNKWFTKEEQQDWKKLLLSNNTGYELIELLIPENIK